MKGKTVQFIFYPIFFILAMMIAGCASGSKPVPRVKDSLTLHVLFDYDKTAIKEKETAELQKGIDFVKRYPGARIEIAGHTDNIGTPQYNQTLSVKRAEAVREYLIREGGVDPAKITAVGHRDLYPVAPNKKPDGKDNPEGRAQNRRVEINILSD